MPQGKRLEPSEGGCVPLSSMLYGMGREPSIRGHGTDFHGYERRQECSIGRPYSSSSLSSPVLLASAESPQRQVASRRSSSTSSSSCFSWPSSLASWGAAAVRRFDLLIWGSRRGRNFRRLRCRQSFSSIEDHALI